MAEYSSKLELCSFGLTKSFIPLGFVRNTKVFPLGFVIFELNIPLGFIRNDNVCARRAQKPSLLGLCRAAANFRASECRAELVRAMPSAAENVKKRCIYMNFQLSSRVFYTPAAQKDNCKLSKSCLGCRHMFQL